MALTVIKTTFPRAEPKTINLSYFRSELRNELKNSEVGGYLHFESRFLKVLEKHAPMRPEIMKQSTLKNKYLKHKPDDSFKTFKRQKNYTNKLAKRERNKFFAGLDLKQYTDNYCMNLVVIALFFTVL